MKAGVCLRIASRVSRPPQHTALPQGTQVASLATTLTSDLTLTQVQGYECHTLVGLRRLASAGRLASLKVEVAEQWLSGHRCSSTGVLHRLRALGFAVGSEWQRQPSCFRRRYGCDIVAWHHSASLLPQAETDVCRWAPSARSDAPGRYWECLAVRLTPFASFRHRLGMQIASTRHHIAAQLRAVRRALVRSIRRVWV